MRDENEGTYLAGGKTRVTTGLVQKVAEGKSSCELMSWRVKFDDESQQNTQ